MMKTHEARQTELGYVSPSAETFKYVGSDGDADSLKSAQATMVAAQMYLNNEIESRLYKSDFPLDIGVSSVGAEFIDGLKQKALGDLKTASSILGQEGHGGAAARAERRRRQSGQPRAAKIRPRPRCAGQKNVRAGRMECRLFQPADEHVDNGDIRPSRRLRCRKL